MPSWIVSHRVVKDFQRFQYMTEMLNHYELIACLISFPQHFGSCGWWCHFLSRWKLGVSHQITENHFKLPFWRLDKHNVYKNIYNIHNLHNMFRMHMQNVLLDISIIYTYTYIYISIYTFFETVPLWEWIYTWACPLGPHHSWTPCPGVFLLGGGTVRMIWRGGLPFLFEQINHRKLGELCLNVLTYPLNWCSARW